MGKGVEKLVFGLSAIEIYELVLVRRIKKFPDGFWIKPEAEQNAIEVTKYMIEKILKWGDKEITSNLMKKIFVSQKLGGMLYTIYQDSPYKAINKVYPDKYKPWEFTSCPNNYWNNETGLIAVKWMIEEKLKWTKKDIEDKLDYEVFIKYGLIGMLDAVYNHSPYKAINTLYPEKFNQWNLKQTSKNYWTMEKGIMLTKWMIEEKLKWSKEDVEKRICENTFYDNDLSGMLSIVFEGSVYKALQLTYPNKYKPWLLKASKHYWTMEMGIDAIKWLVEDVLNMTPENALLKLTNENFRVNGLRRLLNVMFKNSIKVALETTYPKLIK